MPIQVSTIDKLIVAELNEKYFKPSFCLKKEGLVNESHFYLRQMQGESPATNLLSADFVFWKCHSYFCKTVKIVPDTYSQLC